MVDRYPELGQTEIFLQRLKEVVPSCFASDGTPIVEIEQPQGDPPPQELQPFQVEVAIKYVHLYHSAKKRNLDFDLSIRDVAELLRRTHCFYTGVPFKSNDIHHRTIDRLNNRKGYVKGNVAACTHNANQVKAIVFEGKDREKYMSPQMMLTMIHKMIKVGAFPPPPPPLPPDTKT